MESKVLYKAEQYTAEILLKLPTDNSTISSAELSEEVLGDGPFKYNHKLIADELIKEKLRQTIMMLLDKAPRNVW